MTDQPTVEERPAPRGSRRLTSPLVGRKPRPAVSRSSGAAPVAAPAPRTTAAAAPAPRTPAAPAPPRTLRAAAPKEPATVRPIRQVAPSRDVAVDAESTVAQLQALRLAVRTGVVRELGPRLERVKDEVKLRELIGKHLDIEVASSPVAVAPSEREQFITATLADMVGWGVLTQLMDDPTVTEVMCNGAYDIYVEREGKLERSEVQFADDAALRRVIDRMLGLCGRRVDEASPMADGRLPDGSRINAIIPPLSIVGPVLTVRRFPERAFTIADLIARDSLTNEAGVFLEACVRGKLNVLISGGTATGKTTMLNVCSGFIPSDERIITIEDSAELRLAQPHVVGLEGRPANIEGAGQISIRDLVKNALRMRPDRIVVGEVRGGEALDMLQAMNTGHEGSLTTVHANTARDALSRIETMVLMSGVDLPLRAIREQIASAFDLILQIERRPDGQRCVSTITEVQGREGDTITLQDVYTRNGMSSLKPTGLRPRVLDKLALRNVTVPTSVLRTAATAGVPTRPGRTK